MKYVLEIELKHDTTYGDITSMLQECTRGAAAYNTDKPEVGEAWPVLDGRGKMFIAES